MKRSMTIGLAMLAGAALGAAAVQGLHAQAKPPIYLVTEIDVSDIDTYVKDYAPKAQALIRSSGGRLVAAGQNVTTLEGEPLPSGDIASRLGGFGDISTMEENGAPDSETIETLLGAKNHLHNNYQDFQAFLDAGGKIGLQHDPLLYGAYLLNPFLVRVEMVPMLVVNQGEVAVVKAYVGLATLDTSGAEFKFGAIVRPGHRGIWQEPLRTGKYPINPHCYGAVVVPTSILTLNWAEATSAAHNLDA